MQPLALAADAGRPLSVLCIGAHSDDIEIGAGGTLLRLLRDRPGSTVRWVVMSANDRRADEARASASDFTRDAASATVDVHDFQESYFPEQWSQIKATFAELAGDVRPDLVIAHRRDDLHQDHRTIGELVWNHFRDHLVAEYEIPKYEGDLGRPNVFVPLERTEVDRKIELLVEHFGSQHDKPWFSAETFRGMMAVRGVECNAASGFAEAFHVRKATIV
jgi:LmbE family N-acetylglucosaminyl deacetylase